MSALPSSSESLAAVDPPLVGSDGTPGLNSPLLAATDVNQPDPCDTPLPTTLPPAQQSTSRQKGGRPTRGRPPIPAPLASLPTQHPAQGSSSPRPRMRLAYVDVPPRSEKRPFPSSDTSSEECNSGINSGHNDPDVWTLDDRHPAFLHDAKDFFLGVRGDDDWWTLLSRYVEFEGLAPEVSPQILIPRD